MNTPRLYLRELHSEDAKDLFQIYADPETMFFTDTEPFKSIEEIINEIAFMQTLKEKGFGT